LDRREGETAGLTQDFGFRVDRLPQILFERHMFRKYTNGRFNGAAPTSPAPAGGYSLLSEQYTKLEKAFSLCAKAKLGSGPALKSASWGMGQMMGFNCAVGGYKSSVRMVQAMVRSEDAQLACIAGFLKANGLAEKLLNKDWTGFASMYTDPILLAESLRHQARRTVSALCQRLPTQSRNAAPRKSRCCSSATHRNRSTA
jgi:hypothetical protein